MKPKALHNLLLFSLVGLAHWFFGNLYETIVMVPNLLSHTKGKIQHWQAFFSLTNPLFFYIPLTPLAVVALILVYKQVNQKQPALKNHLKIASIFALLAFLLGIYIISQINFNLFFGPSNQPVQEVYRLSLLWNILNAVRVLLVGVCVCHVFQGYIIVRQNQSIR